MTENLRRLFAPQQLVVVGGNAAEAAVRSCRAIGYQGDIWPVNPRRSRMDGLECFPDLSTLPGVPDAAFVSVSREQTIPVVAELARLGTGGVVCHASGYAEDGVHGRELQQDLVVAAGEMALIGPNCLGLLNYLDGAALWPEQHGGCRVDRGVAIITQSGNVGQNLTMQRRSLPLAQLVTVGNRAVTGVLDVVEAMLDDSRITAIGLQLEEIPDVARLSRVALEALRRQVPLVVLKSGSSELGARVTLSHTSSLAGSDVLCDALFRRLGIVRVDRVEVLLETLKFLHTHGALLGNRVASASCSGGEAAYVADLAHRGGVELPDFPAATVDRLHEVLGDRVPVRNPLDYHTYIWGKQDSLTECFSAFLGSGADAHLLVLDFPRPDRCETHEFETVVQAFFTAHRATGSRACVVSSLPEGLPEDVGRRLMVAGIAPMQGIADCLAAIAAAHQVGAAQAGVSKILPVEVGAVAVRTSSPIEQLDEVEAKRSLRAFGVDVPAGAVAARGSVGELAARIGFPVVLKALSTTLAHKSEEGAVCVKLTSEAEVERAATGMSGLSDRFLVESMVEGALVELIVGIHRDPQFGLAMTIGTGGVLVELIKDTVTLLLPATAADIRDALSSLRMWPLLHSFRGRSADVNSIVDTVSCIVDYARDHADRLLELEVNPLLVLPDRAVAVDALIRLYPAGTRSSSAPREGDLEDVG